MFYWLKNNWLIASVVIGIIAFGLWELINSSQMTNTTIRSNVSQTEPEMELEEEIVNPIEHTTEPVKQFVDVKGEVMKPDMYEITGEKRVKEVIEMAGGFTDQANLEQVNLAQKVVDEMVIIVPKIGEEIQTLQTTTNETTTSKIPLNTATKEEIETLPGIGGVKADAILQYREENGPFTSIQDLEGITGIGTKTIENLAEFIQIP
ncbi:MULTISPECIES: helix-hairpin-helix domain-containing protein [Paraliobacillus]|uniref:helix-hairpin-helix domain-containing protein n=1 Tax=Paraliobacillus TaxID=200903 RepID=UPI000DD30E83|nr:MULTISPECIES: helix-hairpin-helix domain-containing protein [Paraliobacillus]